MMLNALDAPRRQLPEIDYALLWTVLLLLFAGMVMVYSASIAIAEALSLIHISEPTRPY